MLCFRLRARPRPRVGRLGKVSSTPSPEPSFTRRFSQQWGGQLNEYPVRLLGPAIWSVTAVGSIYITCAAYDVCQDLRKYTKESRHSITFDQIEADRSVRRVRDEGSASEFNPRSIMPASPSAAWNSLNGPAQVMTSVAITSTAVLALSKAPSVSAQNFVLTRLSHIPVEGAFRNSQLLTSAFVHSGPLHLFVNMFVMYNFGPSLAQTAEFNGSGSHTLAFYLSGGIFSALGSHMSSRFWPNKPDRFRPGMGWSGVLGAIFSAWCIEHPDHRLRLFPIPVDFTGMGLLEASVAFETLGLLGVFRALCIPIDVGFAAHLAGIAFGAAYVTFGKDQKFWKLSRRTAFRAMKTMRIT